MEEKQLDQLESRRRRAQQSKKSTVKKWLDTFFVLLYFTLSLFLMEAVLRVATTGQLFSNGLAISFVFALSLALFFTIITRFLKGTFQYIAIIFLLFLAGSIFSSQLIYFRFFRAFYSIYSAGNAGQLTDFARDISDAIADNAIPLLLLFTPFLIMTGFGKWLFSYKKAGWRTQLSYLAFAFSVHIGGVLLVYSGDKADNSAYDLYFKSNDAVLATERLGLTTMMRLDVQRRITGWSPALETLAPVDSQPEPSPVDENKPDQPVEALSPAEQTMPIDFTSLIASEKNSTIKQMHQYFASIEPTTENEYTGKYKGYNLIFLTAEGFSPLGVREDVTPTLYKMIHEGHHFTNFYTPVWGVSTSDGEYVACTGLIPKSGVWSFYESGKNAMPFVMGNQLKTLGYKTVAYHDHTWTYYKRNVSHPNMGYDYKGVGHGLDVKKTWPESDLEMMEKTIPEYIGNEPFHAYYMTVSGHMQYSFTGNYIAYKNRKLVQQLPLSNQAKAYIATQIELDRALAYLLEQLDKAGIADRTLIALSADHYPYGLADETIDELAGHSVERNFELYKNDFILYTAEMEPVTIDKPASSLDIIPTLSNLLGLEYDSRLLIGRDIFSDSEPLVIFQNRSFITDKGRYNAVTREFIPNPGVQVDADYVKRMSGVVNSKMVYSAKILETDYYARVVK